MLNSFVNDDRVGHNNEKTGPGLPVAGYGKSFIPNNYP